PKTSIICSPMTSLKTSIKTITYLSDIGCLEIQGASLLCNLNIYQIFKILSELSDANHSANTSSQVTLDAESYF
ncbi:hypothetical protein, partial [Escherichia coli]|uniref:hypothetical protein n=1 Tax=Escherichia coli TaxID=562 RepID=UPI0021B4CB6A